MNKKIAQVLMLAGLASVMECHAAEPIGRILVAVGEVTVVRDGKEIALTRGAPVESGDTLRTGATSNAQMRLTDGAVVSLRPQTEFRIDEYRFKAKEDGEQKGFFSLVKGGFRTISGLIGKRDHADYKVTTPTSTIGIRGTDYSLVMCAQDCTNADGSKAKGGLYGGVADGKINVANEAGARDFGHSEAFFVADSHTPPQGLIAPPSFLADKLAARSRNQSRGDNKGGDGANQSAQAATITPDGRSSEPETQVALPATQQTTYVAAETVNASGASAVLPPTVNPPEFIVAYSPVNSSMAIQGCYACDPGDSATYSSDGKLLAYSMQGNLHTWTGQSGGVAQDVGSTSIDGTTVTWGRWTGGNVTDPWNGTITPSSGWHFISGGTTPVSVIAGMSGSITYSFAGGTYATDDAGQRGSQMSGGLGVNFTARTVTPDFYYNVNGNYYHIAGFSMPIEGNSFFSGSSSANNTGNCSGSTCGGGRAIDYVVMNGNFVGATGKGIIAGVATSIPGVQSTSAVGLFKAP